MLLVLVFLIGLFSGLSERKRGLFIKLREVLPFSEKRDWVIFFATAFFFVGLMSIFAYYIGGYFSQWQYFLVRMSGVFIVLIGLSVMEVLASPVMSKLLIWRSLKRKRLKSPFIIGCLLSFSWLSYLSMAYLALLFFAFGAKSALLAGGIGCSFYLGVLLGYRFIKLEK